LTEAARPSAEAERGPAIPSVEYRDYYKSLGVPRTATQADIKKAFRKLARQYHPDVNKGKASAEQRFKEINEAPEVLGDAEKRKAYDELGSNWEAYQRAGAQPGAAGGPFAGFGGGRRGTNVRFTYNGNPEDLAGFSDFFRTFFGGSAEPRASRTSSRRTRTSRSGGIEDADLEDLFSRLERDDGADYEDLTRAGRRAQRTVAQDVEAEAEISLEEAYRGTTRLVQIDDRRLEVKIPPGVESGQRIRLSGKAGSGPDAGHVYLRIKVRDHPVFSRSGADLNREQPITLAEALLGAEVPVETLKGRVLLRIPPETQTARTFRLAGQGMPRFRGSGHGDLYVRTRVVLPTGLDEDAQRLVRQLADRVKQPDPRQSDTRRPDDRQAAHERSGTKR
jgi:curved DNA-binding protein